MNVNLFISCSLWRDPTGVWVWPRNWWTNHREPWSRALVPSLCHCMSEWPTGQRYTYMRKCSSLSESKHLLLFCVWLPAVCLCRGICRVSGHLLYVCVGLPAVCLCRGICRVSGHLLYVCVGLPAVCLCRGICRVSGHLLSVYVGVSLGCQGTCG